MLKNIYKSTTSRMARRDVNPWHVRTYGSPGSRERPKSFGSKHLRRFQKDSKKIQEVPLTLPINTV
jgi:hypothetical protein